MNVDINSIAPIAGVYQLVGGVAVCIVDSFR